MEGDPEYIPLPPRVRPFNSERYRPEAYALLPSTVRHFSRFARGAPADLILREPESHLSHGASKFTPLHCISSAHSEHMYTLSHLYRQGRRRQKQDHQRPPPVAWRERQAPTRGRGRHREPIICDDDETSETKEIGDQHDESSESGDDDADSNSASGDEAESGSYAEDDNSGSSSVTPLPTGPAATEAGPSAPPPVAWRERQAPTRGRGRHREPIMRDDDETSETEKIGDQHDESSESGDDDADSNSASGDEAESGSYAEDDNSGSSSASNSDNGADGDSSAKSAPSRKRTKKAFRA
ncbi:uncharacterized protein LOC114287177 [Camellia sinensis]|uniref:uncharacterized protein LOC114287177 n=1 Tax=Camellia sinensis TaxID=4442 RepID=UPI001035B5B1|nr:uncharacterized protein LOC114287177 [Camellia sinensis]